MIDYKSEIFHVAFRSGVTAFRSHIYPMSDDSTPLMDAEEQAAAWTEAFGAY